MWTPHSTYETRKYLTGQSPGAVAWSFKYYKQFTIILNMRQFSTKGIMFLKRNVRKPSHSKEAREDESKMSFITVLLMKQEKTWVFSSPWPHKPKSRVPNSLTPPLHHSSIVNSYPTFSCKFWPSNTSFMSKGLQLSGCLRNRTHNCSRSSSTGFLSSY